jgi:V/A-type H+-transporting ATPase subunit D
MLTIKPTRGELLHTKKKIKLAKKGHDLLKKKQDSLIIEFFRLLKEVEAQERQLQERYVKALRRMSEARALESDLRIRAEGMAVQQTAPIELQARTVAGVRVPVITHERRMGHHRYSSLMLQETGSAYMDVVEEAIALAAKETALRKILAEIKKTKRRAHALEQILIPQLVAAEQHIQFELEERGRENFARLKRRKS